MHRKKASYIDENNLSMSSGRQLIVRYTFHTLEKKGRRSIISEFPVPATSSERERDLTEELDAAIEDVLQRRFGGNNASA